MHNILFKPGTVVKTSYSNQRYLVISDPIVVRSIQHLVGVVPISNNCAKKKHLAMPDYALTKGEVCLHLQDTLNCEDLKFIERLNENFVHCVKNNVVVE